MAKNILIFSDGTGQAGGLRPEQRLSNIYKLYRATKIGPESDIDPKNQLAFYDAGLGSELDDSVVNLPFLRWFWKLFSSVTGTGISRNIADCYEYILKNYNPGDRIYLFGFSRGAYTVRCLGGVLKYCGVPTTDADGKPIVNFGSAIRKIADEAVNDVYGHGAGKNPTTYAPEREIKGERFRKKYNSDVEGKSNAIPYFIGVFDTVAALGMKGARRFISFFVASTLFFAAMYGVALLTHIFIDIDTIVLFTITTSITLIICAFWYLIKNFRLIKDYPVNGKFKWHIALGWKFKFYDLSLNPNVYAARHALAIDETRHDFDRVGWGNKTTSIERKPGEPIWLQQLWFSGCHSDIGGSYPEDESRLSDVSLNWMLEQVSALPYPIHYDASKLHLFPDPLGLMHSEVFASKEKIDKWFPNWWPENFRPGWEIRIRTEASGAPLHPSVEHRIKADSVSYCGARSKYMPEALSYDPRYPDLCKVKN